MKHLNLLKATAVAALLVASGAAVAGPTATLQVRGTITPAACIPTLSGDGIADFGTTSSSEITGDKLLLPLKTMQLAVDCAAATKIAFSVTDNRAGTAVSGISNFPGGLADFGLGKTTDDEKIGSYVIYPANPVIDGSMGTVIGSSDLASWHDIGAEVISTYGSAGSDSYISVASSGETTPLAFTNMTMDLGVFPFLGGEMKNITELQYLDGNATLNFDYL
jgi:hypothetical protein